MKSRYVRHLAIATVLAFCANVLLKNAGYTAAQSADGTALILLALLAFVTALTPAVKDIDDEPAQISAARLLVLAGTAASASIGASRTSGHVALFIIGFFVAIPYLVHALMKELDDHLSLAFLLLISLIQVGLVFWIVS